MKINVEVEDVISELKVQLGELTYQVALLSAGLNKAYAKIDELEGTQK